MIRMIRVQGNNQYDRARTFGETEESNRSFIPLSLCIVLYSDPPDSVSSSLLAGCGATKNEHNHAQGDLGGSATNGPDPHMCRQGA